MVYGHEILGAPPQTLLETRRAARACLTDSWAGKSLTIDLALRDGVTDPAYALSRGPLMQWAKGVWSGAVPLGWPAPQLQGRPAG